MASEKLPQVLSPKPVFQITAQQSLDGIRYLVGRATVADRPSYPLVAAHGSAQAEVIGVHHAAIGLYLLALNSNVRNPVLAAAVGAAGHVQLQWLIELRQP